MPYEEPQLLTTIEVSRLLDLSPDRIRQLARAGGLPFISTGTGVRIFERMVVEEFRRRREQRNPCKARDRNGQ